MIRKAALTAAILAGLALPSAVEAEPICYDAKIRARPVEQIPSEIPDCGDGCIIMSWPWFVDLKVKRVVDGALPGRMVRILTVQHSYRPPRTGTWLLRKNTAGGYNNLSYENGVTPVRCPADAAPVQPYLRPGEGQTLDEFRDAGLRRYGHFTR